MLYRLAFLLMSYCTLLGLLVTPKGAEASPLETVIVVQSSPEAARQTEVPLSNKSLIQALKSPPSSSTVGPLPLTDTYVVVKDDITETKYYLDDQGQLYEEKTRMILQLPMGLQGTLAKLKQEARGAHYGLMIPWSKVQELIPMKSVSTVTDVETGLKFQVQRRAGKQHADMQPLTKADTDTMKKIYDGQWSWRRRAVLVEREGHRLAASMHGMPHGGDGIPDNGFSGHFCIHFLDSTTHGSGQVDPDHQWMVRKAAGRYSEAFANASPPQIIESFIIAMNQKDSELLKHGFAQLDHPQLLSFLKEMKELKVIPTARSKTQAEKRGQAAWDGLIAVSLPVELTLHPTGRRPESQTFIFEIRRISVDTPWKIQEINRTSSFRSNRKSP